jgi:hypothetical protein
MHVYYIYLLKEDDMGGTCMAGPSMGDVYRVLVINRLET